jgi:4'-phosphopantetheinyl transferase
MTSAEVHVWCARLDGTEYRGILSPDELARAARYRFDRDRLRFIWFRGLLRTILGRQLERPPESIRFALAPGGKPYVPDSWLRFNVSDSQEYALIAVACDRELGVDIEFIRPDVARSGIAERFFSPGECAALHALAPPERVGAFFNCWTRKEAYLKARGCGLALPLARFEVSVAPHQPPALLRAPEGAEEVARWKIQDLDVPPGFAAALAAEGHDWEIHLHRL